MNRLVNLYEDFYQSHVPRNSLPRFPPLYPVSAADHDLLLKFSEPWESEKAS